jgi:hypothetical protein
VLREISVDVRGDEVGGVAHQKYPSRFFSSMLPA